MPDLYDQYLNRKKKPQGDLYEQYLARKKQQQPEEDQPGVLESIEGFGAGLGRSVLRAGESIAALEGYVAEKVGAPSDNVGNYLAGKLRGMQGTLDKQVQDQGLPGSTYAAGAITGNVGLSVLPGLAAGKALSGASKVAQVAGGMATSAAISAAQAAPDAEGSTTGWIGQTASESKNATIREIGKRLNELAANTGTRIASDVVLNEVFGQGLVGGFKVARKGVRAAGKALDVSEGMVEAGAQSMAGMNAPTSLFGDALVREGEENAYKARLEAMAWAQMNKKPTPPAEPATFRAEASGRPAGANWWEQNGPIDPVLQAEERWAQNQKMFDVWREGLNDPNRIAVRVHDQTVLSTQAKVAREEAESARQARVAEAKAARAATQEAERQRVRDAVTQFHAKFKDVPDPAIKPAAAPVTEPAPVVEPTPAVPEQAVDFTEEMYGGQEAPKVSRARTAGGSVKWSDQFGFTKLSDDEVFGEYATLIDLNAQENIAPTVLENLDNPETGTYVGMKDAAIKAAGRKKQRAITIAKLEKEISRRGYDTEEAYMLGRGREVQDDLSFDVESFEKEAKQYGSAYDNVEPLDAEPASKDVDLFIARQDPRFKGTQEWHKDKADALRNGKLKKLQNKLNEAREGHAEATNVKHIADFEKKIQKLEADIAGVHSQIEAVEKAGSTAETYRQRSGREISGRTLYEGATTVLAPIMGTVVGGTIGDTPEERAQNAKRGFYVGAAVMGAYLGGGLWKKIAAKNPKAVVQGQFLQHPAASNIAKSIATEPTAAPKQSFPGKVNELYQQVINSVRSVEVLDKAAGAGGKILNEFKRAGSFIAPAALRVEEKFFPIMQEYKDVVGDVAVLAKAQRALELAAYGLDDKGVDLAEAAQTVQFYAGNKKAQDGAKAIQGYYRELLDYKYQNGVISTDQYNAIVEKGEYYTPFVRDFGAEKTNTLGFGRVGKYLNRIPGVRKMTEGKAVSKTVDPFYQAIHDTLETERRVAKQRATNVLAYYAANNPQGLRDFVREVPAPASATHPTITKGEVIEVNINGSRRYMHIVDEGLSDSLASMNPVAQDAFVKLLGKGKNVLQVGVTANPAFTAANFARDFASSITKYPIAYKEAGVGAVLGAGYGAYEDGSDGALAGAILGGAGGAYFPHAARTLQALADILGKTKTPVVGATIGGLLGGYTADDGEALEGALKGAVLGAGLTLPAALKSNPDIYKEWIRQGGPGHGFFARTQADVMQLLEHAKAQPGFDVKDVIHPKSWWEAIQTVNRAVEQAPRLARFKYLKGEGLDNAAAVAGSKDISVNFEQAGSSTFAKVTGATTAFWNPKMQGFDWLARNLNPTTAEGRKGWAKGAMLLTAPTLALWTINKDNEEYWQQSQFVRNTFWLIPKDGGGFYKVPKPFELGYIFASIPERFLDWQHQRDPERTKTAFKDMGASVISDIVPLPTVAKTGFQMAAGYDFFRGKPIENASDKNLAPGVRFDDRTSTLATVAGGAMNVSPKMIDFTIGSSAGTLGQIVTRAVGNIMRGYDLDPRGQSFIPTGDTQGQFSRFATQPNQQTDDEQTIFRRFGQAEQVYNTLNFYYRNGFDDDGNVVNPVAAQKAQAYLQQNLGTLKEYGRLKTYANALRDIAKAKRQILSSQESAEEKDRKISRLAKLASEIAHHHFTAEELEGSDAQDQ